LNQSKSVFPKLIKVIIAMVIVIVILFCFVFLFTRNTLFDIYWLGDKGAIGDAINGMTAPIITLISAGLIFYSFLAQIEANKLQVNSNKMIQSQWEFDTYSKLFNEITTAYQKLEIHVGNKYGKNNEFISKDTRTGMGFIHYLTENANDWDKEDIATMLGDIEFILEDFVVLIDYLNKSEINQKDFLQRRIVRFYNMFLENPLTSLKETLNDGEPYFQRYFTTYKKLVTAIDEIKK
jgi:hypothetical protein